MAGMSCLSFAATALLSRIRHQTSPSIGPGLMLFSKAVGTRLAILLRRAVDSALSAVKWASVGDSFAACRAVIDRWFLDMTANSNRGSVRCR